MSKEFEQSITITYYYYLNDTKIILHFLAFGDEMAKNFIKDCIETYHYKVIINDLHVERLVFELFNEYFELRGDY